MNKKSKEEILISTTSFGEYDNYPIELLKKSKFDIILNPYGRKLQRAEVIDLAKNVAGIIAGTEPLDSFVLEKLPNLKVISRCGVGVDNVDLSVAKKLGVSVFNTPYGPTLAVAELTVGLMIDLLRRITQVDRELRNGRWQKEMGNLLQNKKIGIIGFGKIGQKVAELLFPFGVKIFYYDSSEITCLLNCDPLDFELLLSWADIITIHMSGSSSSKPIIGEKEIRMMKVGAWLINTARGGLVDEKALYKALKDHHLSGVALDVFEREPYMGQLSELSNVILTPHIGSYAREARVGMELEAVKNLLEGFGLNS